MLALSILLLPVVTAAIVVPQCIIKTVSVTETVWADSITRVPSTTKATSANPTWFYTFTSLKAGAKGETITSDRKKTVLTAPTA